MAFTQKLPSWASKLSFPAHMAIELITVGKPGFYREGVVGTRSLADVG